jgi:hypothetical protein
MPESMKVGDHGRAAEADEPAEQVADDDAVVLRAIQAITAPAWPAGGSIFPAPIDGSARPAAESSFRNPSADSDVQ